MLPPSPAASKGASKGARDGCFPGHRNRRRGVRGRQRPAKAGAPAPERPAMLQRGLQAALRDGELDNLAWFQTQLGVVPAAPTARAQAGTVTVPGGFEALSFVAHCRPSSPERFLRSEEHTSELQS